MTLLWYFVLFFGITVGVVIRIYLWSHFVKDLKIAIRIGIIIASIILLIYSVNH